MTILPRVSAKPKLFKVGKLLYDMHTANLHDMPFKAAAQDCKPRINIISFIAPDSISFCFLFFFKWLFIHGFTAKSRDSVSK